MKPIILNLLVEEQLAEEANVRDPVKIAALIGVGLLVVVTAVGYFVSWRADQKAREAATMQKQHDAANARVTEGTGDLRTWRLLANDVVAINNSRSLFAWQLAWLKDVVPETILLRSVSLVVNTEAVGAPPAPGDPKSELTARATISNERVLLRIEGMADCAKPEIEVDEFIKTMQNHADIKANMEKVSLRSIARIADSAKGPVAQFVIECQYKGQPL